MYRVNSITDPHFIIIALLHALMIVTLHCHTLYKYNALEQRVVEKNAEEKRKKKIESM